MKIILPIVLLFSIISTPFVFGAEVVENSDLVQRGGIFYKKFSNTPFTGKITGQHQGTLRNGKKEGSWVDYHYNGQLWMEGVYKDGKREGLWHAYYDTGVIWSLVIWKDGKANGPSMHWHRNGQLWSKGVYKDGKREGLWVTYNENGNLTDEEILKNGRAPGASEWCISHPDSFAC